MEDYIIMPIVEDKINGGVTFDKPFNPCSHTYAIFMNTGDGDFALASYSYSFDKSLPQVTDANCCYLKHSPRFTREQLYDMNYRDGFIGSRNHPDAKAEMEMKIKEQRLVNEAYYKDFNSKVDAVLSKLSPEEIQLMEDYYRRMEW